MVAEITSSDNLIAGLALDFEEIFAHIDTVRDLLSPVADLLVCCYRFCNDSVYCFGIVTSSEVLLTKGNYVIATGGGE